MRNYKRKTERKPRTPEMLESAKQMLRAGQSKRSIARDLGITEGALKKKLKMVKPYHV
ncbi:hypothetical protein J6590_100191 [Homalodisca vitripennis]|nr:hypothetical protein J6590_100191 [Homalodisca vitripennis]